MDDTWEENPELLRAVLAAAPDFITVLALDGRLLFHNRYVPGFGPADVMGASVYDFLDPASHEAARACFAKVLATGRLDSYESVGLGAHRALTPYETRVAPIHRDGKIVAFLLVGTDVGERKRVEKALRESEGTLRMAVAATDMGLWSWDPVEDVIVWDDRMLEIFGRTREDAPRRIADYVALAHPEDRHKLAARVGDARAGRVGISENRIVRKDGQVRWVQVRGAAVTNAAGRITKLTGGMLDVTARHELEARLRDGHMLEDIGRLTAGIAHNFNNLLMAIVPNIERAIARAGPESRVDLETAALASRRAAELVRGLLVLAGSQGPAARAPHDARALVERVLAICRSTFDPRIAIGVENAGSVPPASVDPAEIEQAILNLCLNARDAVRDVPEPRLVVSIDAVPAPADEPGPRVRIRVNDNGHGMDEATRARIFEPFFTTKKVGEGTGLGLATARAVVLAHGGSIECASTPGAGTTFSITLPRATGVPAEEAPPEPGAPAPDSARPVERRILVVEDEPAVRETVRRILTEAGHAVTTASSGEEGLRVFEGAPAGFDLALLDLSLPGMSGRELGREIRARRPSQRLALFSGFALEPTPEVDAVLTKPLGAADLLAAVEALLETVRA